ncbi:MAG: transketolase [Chloroflexota bacterium]|nr:transketolase [Chloroflexota bacterium]
MTAPKIADRAINTIRFLAVDATNRANSGHPGLPMGAAPMAYVLWTQFMRYNPKNPYWFNRDRFILSAGHGCMLLYALLHLTGYEDMTMEQIKRFRQWKSITPGHPENFLADGVEVTTGPLGQGFANGVGMAIAEAYLAARFNQPGHEIIDHNIYAIVSDGDLMEGISQEAASLAGHLKLHKLIYLYDDNHITIDGRTTLTFTEDTAKRFEAYGWHVQQIDGMNLDEVEAAIRAAQAEKERPSIIAARTIIGYGSPHMAGTADVHGKPLGEEEAELTRENLGWPDERFYVPDDVLAHYREAIDRGQRWESEWQQRWEAYQAEYPDLAEELTRMLARELPEGWDEELPTYEVGSKSKATRAYSGEALNAIAPHLPELLGGSADLTGSTLTKLEGEEDFMPREWGGSYAGRNLYFGVREHAMGGIVNGMYLHGALLPYGATFLIFTDYMRAAIRLSALSRAHCIWVMTHDSIGLGEDGPTHQPIEQLPGLRAIPNLHVIRPADGNETSAAWRVAVARRDGPVLLSLTRQGVPVLEGTKEKAWEGVDRGGYVLRESDGEPEIILIGSGSEVQHCVGAAELLEREGVRARVVSMPSLDRFLLQDEAYRNEVLPPHVRNRLAVEAAAPQSWYQVVGLDGDVIGLDRFGASAPGEVVMEELGFNVENVLEHAQKLLAQPQGEVEGESRRIGGY